MKLLLHICCGPCSLYVIDALRSETDIVPEGTPITGYFYNPNIHPYDELVKRSVYAGIAAAHKNIPLITRLDYEPAHWITYKGEKSARCRNCYRVRFEESVRFAAKHGYTHFTSTLFVSPYQDQELMAEEARKACRKYGITFLEGIDFTKGYHDGRMQAKELGLYRQKYCGCIRSLKGE